MLTLKPQSLTHEEVLELPRITQNVEEQSSSFSSTLVIQHELMALNSRLSKALNFTNLELTTPEQTRAEIHHVADAVVSLLAQVKSL